MCYSCNKSGTHSHRLLHPLILVGANKQDHRNKWKMLRLDRISSQYEILGTFTHVGNPLGGGIYIQVRIKTVILCTSLFDA